MSGTPSPPRSPHKNRWKPARRSALGRRAMGSDAPLGLLVLSAVRHAASYLPIFAAHPDTVIRAIVEEPDAPAWAHNDARLLAERYHVPVSRDPASALTREDSDLVLVCSEPTRHARLAAQALRA